MIVTRCLIPIQYVPVPIPSSVPSNPLRFQTWYKIKLSRPSLRSSSPFSTAYVTRVYVYVAQVEYEYEDSTTDVTM